MKEKRKSKMKEARRKKIEGSERHGNKKEMIIDGSLLSHFAIFLPFIPGYKRVILSCFPSSPPPPHFTLSR